VRLEFGVAGKPAVQGNHAVSPRGYIFEKKSKELIDWREALGWRAKLAMGAGKVPAHGAMHVRLEFYLERPKTSRQSRPTVKPDLDKLARAALDAMTGIVWVDDSQVVELTAEKHYSPDAAGVGCLVIVDAPEAVAA
jgi:crossover junction endodeoxyribonuclease RusA